MKNRILILLTLIIVAITCFCFSKLCFGMDDDMYYRFVFDNDNLENLQTLRPVVTWSDIVDSQIYHYLHVNGRAPIHVLVQSFVGIWGKQAFAMANALVFIAFISMLTYYIFPRKSLRNPWLWGLTAAFSLYAMPGAMRLWYEVAFGINYLWAGALFLFMLLLLRHFKTIPRVSPATYVLLAITGFFAGWSQEAFALPLSGALFLYCLFVLKKLPTGPFRVLTISLWIGTALLVFSPGTFTRIGDKTASWGNVVITLLECYMEIRIFWLMLATAFTLLILNRLNVKHLFQNNPIVCIALILAVTMSSIAHTFAHSLTCIELMSFILLIDILRCARIRLPKLSPRISAAIYLLCLGAASCHLYAIYVLDNELMNQYKRMEQEFGESIDGVIHQVSPPTETGMVVPFAIEFKRLMLPEPNSTYSITFAAFNNERTKIPFALSKADFDAIITNPDSFFVEKNRVPGSANLYEGDQFYFARIDKTDSVTPVIAKFHGDGFMKNLPPERRFIYKLLGSKKAPKQLLTFSADTRKGRYLVALKILSAPSVIDVQ